MDDKGKIVFRDENGQEDEYYIVEMTKLGDTDYIMVTDSPSDQEEADAYILKDISGPEDEEAIYVFVEDDRELKVISEVFAELLEDTDIE